MNELLDDDSGMEDQPKRNECQCQKCRCTEEAVIGQRICIYCRIGQHQSERKTHDD